MTVAQISCGHCSAAVDSADKFCRGCGSRLEPSVRTMTSPLLNQPYGVEQTNLFLRPEIVLVSALATFLVSAVLWSLKPHAQPAGNVQVKNFKPVSAHQTEIERLFSQANSPPAKDAPTSAVDTARHVQAISDIKAAAQIALSSVKQSTRPSIRSERKSWSISPEESIATQKSPVNNGPDHAKTAAAAGGDADVEATVKTSDEHVGPSAEPKQAAASETKPAALSESKRASADKKLLAQKTKVDEVAEYNRKLADFFSHRNGAAGDTTDGASAPVEPPSFDEWIQSGKADF